MGAAFYFHLCRLSIYFALINSLHTVFTARVTSRTVHNPSCAKWLPHSGKCCDALRCETLFWVQVVFLSMFGYHLTLGSQTWSPDCSKTCLEVRPQIYAVGLVSRPLNGRTLAVGRTVFEMFMPWESIYHPGIGYELRSFRLFPDAQSITDSS